MGPETKPPSLSSLRLLLSDFPGANQEGRGGRLYTHTLTLTRAHTPCQIPSDTPVWIDPACHSHSRIGLCLTKKGTSNPSLVHAHFAPRSPIQGWEQRSAEGSLKMPVVKRKAWAFPLCSFCFLSAGPTYGQAYLNVPFHRHFYYYY